MTAKELFNKTDRRSYKVDLDRPYSLTAFLDQLGYIFLYQTLGNGSDQFVAEGHAFAESLTADATIFWKKSGTSHIAFSNDTWRNTPANTNKFLL